MEIVVRPAVRGDIGWIVPRLMELDGWYGSRHSLFHPGHVERALPDFLGNHCCLAACSERGSPLGVVGGFLIRHPMNPEIVTLAEIFWHVSPGENRAAIALLDAFVEWGRWRRADWITFSLMAAVPAGRRALERRGFRQAESVFLLER